MQPRDEAHFLIWQVRNELFPVRDSERPLSFMHNMVSALRRALAWSEPPPPINFVISGQFDSNPCRATCMLNPLYDLLPRMQWVVDSRICQRREDFVFDEPSQSLCCPSPNYCCPNSLVSCAASAPGSERAVRYDVLRAGVSPAVIRRWPLHQNMPYWWDMTPASFEYVARVWMNATHAWRRGEPHSPAQFHRAAVELIEGAEARRLVPKGSSARIFGRNERRDVATWAANTVSRLKRGTLKRTG